MWSAAVASGPPPSTRGHAARGRRRLGLIGGAVALLGAIGVFALVGTRGGGPSASRGGDAQRGHTPRGRRRHAHRECRDLSGAARGASGAADGLDRIGAPLAGRFGCLRSQTRSRGGRGDGSDIRGAEAHARSSASARGNREVRRQAPPRRRWFLGGYSQRCSSRASARRGRPSLSPARATGKPPAL